MSERIYAFHEDGKQTSFCLQEHGFTPEQIEQQRAAQEEIEAKYGGLSHEEMLHKMGQEFRDEIEAPLKNDAFELNYLVDVSINEKLDLDSNLFIETVNGHQPEPDAPDTLTISIRYPKDSGKVKITPDVEVETVSNINIVTLRPIKIKMFPSENGISFQSGDRTIRLGIGSTLYAKKLYEFIEARNVRFGWTLPQGQETREIATPLSAFEYSIHTSQEWQAVLQAACDGKNGTFLVENEQAGTLRHQRPGAPFYTEARLLDAEKDGGYSVELLKAATSQLDIDAGYILLYISRLLAPPCELQPNTAAIGWVDLDDVARKTLGGYAPNPEELAKRREKVWNAIRFGARWFVGGQRSIEYQEKQTGRKINTEIYTSLWQIMSRQEPMQLPLLPFDTVPVCVELVASRDWTTLTTNPDTAQFLAVGEVLGAIPCTQSSGAWARSLGLGYVVQAGIKKADTVAGKLALTRRQLLENFPSKTAPYKKFLGTTHAEKIHKYWCGAEDILKERGVIRLSEIREPKPMGAKAWQQWLDSPPSWAPGRLLLEALEQPTQKLYQQKPRQLNPAKRVGSSRKTQKKVS